MSKVLFVISPSLNALTDRRKGTTGNKIDCASKHMGNSIRSNAEIALVACAAGLIGKSVLNSNIKDAFNKARAMGAVTAPNIPLVTLMGSKGKYFQKAKEIIKAVPTPVKWVAGALIGLSLLVRTYKKGKIEQKYEDRAQFVDNTFKPEGKNAAQPVKK